MTTNTIKLGHAVDDRSDEERAAAKELDLPAGSFDADALARASNLKTAAGREKAIAAADETAKETVGIPGYRSVEVVDERLGITENRLVADPKFAAKEAAARGDASAPPPAPSPAAGPAGGSPKPQSGDKE